jgi:hypothetical protein
MSAIHPTTTLQYKVQFWTCTNIKPVESLREKLKKYYGVISWNKSLRLTFNDCEILYR